MKPRRSRPRRSSGRRRPVRAVGVFVLTALFCVALALFPHKSRGQGKEAARAGKATAAPSASAPTSSAGPAHEEQAKPSALEEPAKAAGAAAEESDPTIPTGKGLPVIVRAALFFLELKEFDDTKGEFECITDLRLRWNDTRLAYPPAEAPRGYKEYRGHAADKFMPGVWTPQIEPTNLVEGGESVGRRVRVYPDGDIETITRRPGRYKVHVDAQQFPFDRQHLVVDYIIREDTTDAVLLDFQYEDVEFSRTARDAKLDGWNLGLVDLARGVVPGWNGDRYSRVSASLFVDRIPTTGVAPIFIPLIASLLIPLLAIWMNTATGDGFEIEAFELANISIGGLFSVIALSFAIYSSYGVIAGGDNTVTRLFGLNYLTLALSLSVVIGFYRFNFPRRLFGPYVAEQIFLFICWALPILTLGTSMAFLLVAAS